MNNVDVLRKEQSKRKETSKMEAIETETQATEVTRRPRTRIGHDRSRFVRALEGLVRATDAPFDPPTLAVLADVSDDEYEAIRSRVISALAFGIDGVGNAKAPAVDVQIENIKAWQRERPTYYHWDEASIDALRRKLEALGPGCELIPCFAMSVQVKLPNGRLILINRRGEETKS